MGGNCTIHRRDSKSSNDEGVGVKETKMNGPNCVRIGPIVPEISNKEI